MDDDLVMVQARIPRELVLRLDHFRIDQGMTRTETIIAALMRMLASTKD